MIIIDLATKAMQTAIKSVVDSIKSVVDSIKTTTDGTKTKVDTIDTRTNTMNTNVNTVNTNLNTVNTNLGSPMTSANNATSANAHAKLNYLLANMPTGIVKSVQRGLFTDSGTYADITINTVNPNKCLVTVEGGGGTYNAAMALYALTANQIRFRRTVSSAGMEYSYQIVEFY